MFDSIQRNISLSPDRGLHIYSATFEDTPEFLSYSELPNRIGAYAHYFRQQGLRVGTRVVFPFETSSSTILSFLALMEIGAIPLSVKPNLPFSPKAGYEDFLERVVRDYSADYILDVGCLSEINTSASRIGLPAPSIRMDNVTLRTPNDDEIAFVQLSSGSTSFPKGIPVRYDNLRSNLSMISRHQDGREPWMRSSSWLPLYHDMGLVGGLLSCIFTGLDFSLATPIMFLSDTKGWWEHLSRERIVGTVIPNFAVDYSLKLMKEVDREELSALDLSELQLIYLGSEPINIPNLVEFLELMATAGMKSNVFQPCYGLAEAVLMVSSRPPRSSLRIQRSPSGIPAISVGSPMPGFDMRLRNEQGELCGEDELGEIELAGGSLAPEYFEGKHPMPRADGFYRTGDIGFVNDGELFITGREGDRIKINGQSLFATDFEQVIERLPFVREGRTTVFRHDDDLIVLAEIDGGARQDLNRSRAVLISHLAENIGATVEPSNVHFLRSGQLERTSSGKLKRRAIALKYRQGIITTLA